MVFTLVIAIAVQPRPAQVTTATLAGRVLDSRVAASLPGVTVTARQTETGLQRSDHVRRAGALHACRRFHRATYEIRAELPASVRWCAAGSRLTIAQTAVVDLTMTVGGVAER